MLYDWQPRRESLAAAGYKLRVEELTEKRHPRPYLVDAVAPNGQRVMLKAISSSEHPHEIAISRLFSAPAHAKNPRNHCISIMEVLPDPHDSTIQIIVMPLCIPFHRPKFDTVGEVVDCIRQILDVRFLILASIYASCTGQGIQYMHENYVAHRDCNFTNILQDPDIYPDGDFHPSSFWMDAARKHLSRPITRTECWPRYHLIDFGLSRQYDPSHGPPLEGVILGGDKTPPEHRISLACNPFPTDIYFLGNLLRSLARPTFRPGGISQAPPHPPLSFLLPLIDQMMHAEPSMRPTVGDVIAQFATISGHLTKADLRRPARPLSWQDSLRHRLRQVKRSCYAIAPLPPHQARIPAPPLSDEMRYFFTQVPQDNLVAASCS
ncbi:kinase domain-containing protein [Favolaschia claudopus]|uniref:Kinase domain-containing protein n=1 Tax=Favolaschia claudopus TaxID=2862362 RepID=A0AAW0BEY1_9AGAR